MLMFRDFFYWCWILENWEEFEKYILDELYDIYFVKIKEDYI